MPEHDEQVGFYDKGEMLCMKCGPGKIAKTPYYEQEVTPGDGCDKCRESFTEEA